MVTGQFVLPRVLEPGTRSGRRLLRYLVRTGLLYLGCILLYLPLGIYAGHYQALTPGKILRLLLWDGTFYHLWYFPACMLGMTLLWLLSRRLGPRALAAACGALYLLGLSGDSYYGLTEYLPHCAACATWASNCGPTPATDYSWPLCSCCWGHIWEIWSIPNHRPDAPPALGKRQGLHKPSPGLCRAKPPWARAWCWVCWA